VRNVLFVFPADVLDQVGIGEQFGSNNHGPGLLVRLGIVNGDLDVHVSKVEPAVPFDQA
jgi:hypothetical protein